MAQALNAQPYLIQIHVRLFLTMPLAEIFFLLSIAVVQFIFLNLSMLV